MTEAQKQSPKLEEIGIKIPQVDNFFYGPIPEDMKPKQGYLKPWFKFFREKLGKELGLDPHKISLTEREFTIAHVLKQVFFDSPNQQRLPNLDEEKLRLMGMDPARILRFLILQTTYPKGIDLNNPRITLGLDRQNLEKLREAIEKIPGYQKFDLESLIQNLGFSYNKDASNYILMLIQDGFRDFLKKIIFTSSVKLSQQSQQGPSSQR